MVAASKLRRAQAAAEAARPYAERMEKVLGNIAGVGDRPRLGAEAARRHRQRPGPSAGRLHRRARPVRRRSTRRSCGSRASSIDALIAARARTVKILCVGRKGYDQLRRHYAKQIIETIELRGVRTLGFEHAADDRARRSSRCYEQGAVRRRHAVLLALQVGDRADPDRAADHPAGVRRRAGRTSGAAASYEYEPDEDDILAELLPRNIAVQIFRALLENAASFDRRADDRRWTTPPATPAT